MTIVRILVLGALIALAVPIPGSVRAETATARPSATAHPEYTTNDYDWNGTGGVYRIVAMSAGVLAGAGAMSLFIDGWVVDTFMKTGNLTAAEAFEIVQDMESQGGFEAAAILLSGIAGGLIGDTLYLKTAAMLPGALESAHEAFRPPMVAVGTVWTSAFGWVRDRTGDTSDWIQNRTRETWDRWRAWREPPTP